MRIAHVCRVAPPSVGGMEGLIAGLATRTSDVGHTVWWVTCQAQAAPSVGSVPIVELQRVGHRRWPWAWGLSRRLTDADVIHVHGIDGLLDQVLATRRSWQKVVLSTHGGYLHTSAWWPLKMLARVTHTPRALAACDGVWYSSPVDAARFPTPGGIVVPNGVDLRAFRGAGESKGPLIVIPGRIDVHKGHDDALAALAALRDQAWEAVIVGRSGPPSLHARLDAKVRASGLTGRVRFVLDPDTSVLASWLRRATLALFPSRAEGFGVGMVEAQAAGAWPIVRASSSVASPVEAGSSGDVLDWSSPSAVARTIGERLRHPPDVQVLRAAAERHAWENVLPRWLSAYEAVVGR